MVLCSHYCKTSSLPVIIHYCIVVIALVVFEATIRIFVRAQHVTLINFIAVLVEKASELTDGIRIYAEIIEHFAVVVFKNSFRTIWRCKKRATCYFSIEFRVNALALNLIALIVLFLLKDCGIIHLFRLLHKQSEVRE